MMGARAPTWNEHARGTLFGLTLAHTRAHVARAILEGSAYAVRDCTDRMQALGLPLRELRVVGGGARSRLWNQIKADLTGLPVSVPHCIETTALGAALLALVGSGAYPSLAQACQGVVEVDIMLEPRLQAQAVYEPLYQLYRQLYDALLPAFDAAARLAHNRPA
jgi:xylulokinase